MTRARCPRVWEAEAVEDARLDGVGRASFERHAATCEACAHERYVWSLLRTMVKRLPAVASTPLERRRLRKAILARANRQTFAWSGRRGPWVRVVGGVALAAIVLGCLLWRRTPRTLAVIDSPLGAPTFDVHPIGSAEWHLERAGARTELRLRAGVVAFHVGKITATQRFLLMLPDGELEVRGTRFLAEVRDGHTDRIEVAEGVVTFRIASDDAHTLEAGEKWHREPATELAPMESPADDAGASVEPAVNPARSGRKLSTAAATIAEPLLETPRSARALAGVAFAGAMAAFDEGSYDRAEEQLADFGLRFPADSRAEDADFMRIIVRTRLGDPRGAEQRAHAYLARHPHGLRHAEVEAFLRRAPANADGL